MPKLALRIRGKAILLMTGLFAVFAIAVVAFSHVWLKAEVEAEVMANTRGAMRVLAVTFADAYRGAQWKIDKDVVTTVSIDTMPDAADHAVVDRSEKMISGVATLFATRGARDHVRVSTTVKTEGGARATGTKLAADHPAQAFLERGEAYYGPATLFNKSYITGYQPIKNSAGATVGVLFVGIPTERADTMVSRLSGSTALVTVGVMAVLTLLTFFLVARFVRPITGLTAGMKELAGGKFEVVLPGLERADEIGEMAQAVELFKVRAVEKAQREAEERDAQARAAAEERSRIEERQAEERKAAEERQEQATKEAMHRIVNEFQASVGGVIDTVASAATELEASAGTLTHAADATQQRSNAVAAASEQASANVQSVASATEQLTASLHEINKQVTASSNIARAAVTQALKTDQRINELSQAASRIGDVVKLISAVAEQTNLLALNATIEAARAGEAGKGFAVVASEVKALAGQTAKATGEISTQIAGMQAATEDSVTAIKEIGSTIGQISEIAAAIAAAVEEQGAATAEIARNVDEAAKGTNEVSSNIVEVSQHASETGAASTQMLGSAQALSQEGNRLKSEVEQFLHMIRTGVGERRKGDDPNFKGPDRRQRGSSRTNAAA
jgi:methyl-accepting chemotaxis protein